MSQCWGSRCGGCGEGPRSHRERVSRAKLAFGVLDYLLACLSSFLRSFSSFFRSLSSFLRSLLSFVPDHLDSSFPFLEHFCPSPFVMPLSSLRYYPLPIVRAQLFILFRYSSAFYYIPLRLLFYPLFFLFSILSLYFPPTVRSSR